jgi:hypothetical protein
MTAPPSREDDETSELVWRVTPANEEQARRDREVRDAATARACSGWLSTRSRS